jgi:hypothetical protein
MGKECPDFTGFEWDQGNINKNQKPESYLSKRYEQKRKKFL